MLQPPSRNCIARVCCDITKNDCCLFMGWNYRNMALFQVGEWLWSIRIHMYMETHNIYIYMYICIIYIYMIIHVHMYICTLWHLLWTLILRGWPISYFTKRSERLKWVINRLHQDESMYICIHACMHACRHTDIQTYRHTYIHSYRHTDIHTYINTYIH